MDDSEYRKRIAELELNSKSHHEDLMDLIKEKNRTKHYATKDDLEQQMNATQEDLFVSHTEYMRQADHMQKVLHTITTGYFLFLTTCESFFVSC